MTDPIAAARERLIEVLCEQFPGLWKASAAEPADAILAAFPQIAAPSRDAADAMTDHIAAARSILARPQHHIMPEERIVATYILAAFPQVAEPSRDAADAEMEPVNFATHGARALVPIGARHILAEPSRDAVGAAREVAQRILLSDFDDMSNRDFVDFCAQEIAAAITAAEARVREECARIADDWSAAHGQTNWIGAAIRAGCGR